jgi:disulfide bond formation protein DsbB
MTPFQRRAAGAGAGSAILLFAALAFQYLGGLAPCPICIWQRWPHGVAILMALAIAVLPLRLWAGIGGLAMTTDAGIALYHTGIERKWWPGPDSCTGAGAGQVPPDQLLDQILATPAVLCDQVAWSFLGLSMASWNGIACVALAALWFRTARS